MSLRLLVAPLSALLVLAFSSAFAPAALAETLIVNAADETTSGLCTTLHCNLSQAINMINAASACSTPGACEIAFNLPRTVITFGTGQSFLGPPQTIHFTNTAPPAVTRPVLIDGTTQPTSFSLQRLVFIQGPGGNTSTPGLALRGGGSTVKGLVINGFSRGIVIESSFNQIIGNYIGTDPGGSTSLGNGVGIAVDNGGSNTIGGGLLGFADINNVISGNGIGMTIGGLETHVIGNYIGSDASGTNAVPNHNQGVVFIPGAAGHNAVGDDFEGGNVIAFNGGPGVQFANTACCGIPISTGNRVQANNIFSNGGLGIDESLIGGGLQAAPTITGSTTGVTTVQSGLDVQTVPTTTLFGSVSTTPNSEVKLDFFDNDVCDPSGFGEGQSFVGSRTFTSDTSGVVTFQAQFVKTFALATATVTSQAGDTSVFSRCRFVIAPFRTGTPRLSPADATADVHQRLTYTFKWTVPPPATWHDLTSLQLRLRNDSTLLLQVRWDASTNTFSLFDAASGKFGPAFAPGSNNVLQSSGATLFLKGSSVNGSGPTAPTVTLTLSLGFKSSAAPGEYAVEAAASDDLGHTDTFARVGALNVAR